MHIKQYSPKIFIMNCLINKKIAFSIYYTSNYVKPNLWAKYCFFGGLKKVPHIWGLFFVIIFYLKYTSRS